MLNIFNRLINLSLNIYALVLNIWENLIIRGNLLYSYRFCNLAIILVIKNFSNSLIISFSLLNNFNISFYTNSVTFNDYKRNF